MKAGACSEERGRGSGVWGRGGEWDNRGKTGAKVFTIAGRQKIYQDRMKRGEAVARAQKVTLLKINAKDLRVICSVTKGNQRLGKEKSLGKKKGQDSTGRNKEVDCKKQRKKAQRIV